MRMSSAELQKRIDAAELAVIQMGDDMELRRILLDLRAIAKKIEAMIEDSLAA
jgi:hypothetical protein